MALERWCSTKILVFCSLPILPLQYYHHYHYYINITTSILPLHYFIMASNSDSGTISDVSKNDNSNPNFTMWYDTFQKAKNAIYADAKKQGFGIAIKRSHPD